VRGDGVFTREADVDGSLAFSRALAVLVITPESVSVLLSYQASHDQLRNLECVVVDEWHELLSTKRGVQLELALAHLRALNPNLRLWALSATLPNLDQALRTLVGPHRSGRIIRANLDKQIVVDSLLPHAGGQAAPRRAMSANSSCCV